jgi:serine/threonine protein kinase
MELMSTCLGKLLRHTQSAPVPEPIIGRMTVSIVRALDYLKTVHKIMHRGEHDYTCTCRTLALCTDVKPSNILLDSSGRVKMCDFGISGTLINSIVQSRTGCVAYMAVSACVRARVHVVCVAGTHRTAPCYISIRRAR